MPHNLLETCEFVLKEQGEPQSSYWQIFGLRLRATIVNSGQSCLSLVWDFAEGNSIGPVGRPIE